MMNPHETRHTADSDVLIAAHRNFYPPDLFPGFWDCMEYHFVSGRISLILSQFGRLCFGESGL